MIVLCSGSVVFAEDHVAQTDIYGVGGSKGSDTSGSPAVKQQPGKTDTFGIQDTRGSDGKVSTSGERKESSPFYTNGSSKSSVSPASTVSEKPREGSPFYTNGNGKKSPGSPAAEVQQKKPEAGAGYYSGNGAKNGDKPGSEVIKKSPEAGADAYGVRQTRGTDSTDAAPAKKNGAVDLFGATLIKKLSDDGITVINRPPNVRGLTGLLVTNSAFSRPADTIAVAASVEMESSDRPKFDVFQIPMTITYGITDEIELGIKAKMVSIDDKSGKVARKNSGIGDTEILLKSRVVEQQENFPAVAIGFGGILPTGKESESVNEVTHWGAKFIMLASSEAPILDDKLLGLYVEGQMVFIDEFTKNGSSAPTAERYGAINVGVLMPIAFGNRLQAILEYNSLIKKDKATLKEKDYNAITPAFRFVTKNLSFTLGTQIMNKKAAKYENTVRHIGTISYSF